MPEINPLPAKMSFGTVTEATSKLSQVGRNTLCGAPVPLPSSPLGKEVSIGSPNLGPFSTVEAKELKIVEMLMLTKEKNNPAFLEVIREALLYARLNTN